jgi:hypothetical protein
MVFVVVVVIFFRKSVSCTASRGASIGGAFASSRIGRLRD